MREIPPKAKSQPRLQRVAATRSRQCVSEENLSRSKAALDPLHRLVTVLLAFNPTSAFNALLPNYFSPVGNTNFGTVRSLSSEMLEALNLIGDQPTIATSRSVASSRQNLMRNHPVMSMGNDTKQEVSQSELQRDIADLRALGARPEAEVRDVQSRSARAARLLSCALQREDYARASTLKAELRELRALDPVWSLREELASAVSAENYARAAKLQTELREMRASRPGLMWRNELLVLTRNKRRLVIVGWDSNTGAQTFRELAATKSSNCYFQQPTWDPGGERLAVTEVTEGGSSRVLVISASDGSVLGSFTTPPAFFFYWSEARSGRQTLTFLHSNPSRSSSGIVLRACELIFIRAGDALSYTLGEPWIVSAGGPLFYSIGPGGEMLANNGFSGQVDFSLGGDSDAVDTGWLAAGKSKKLLGSASPCRTPLLSPDASHAIYCEVNWLNIGSLVAEEISSGRKKSLLTVPANSASVLHLSPDGNRLVVIRGPGKLAGVERQAPRWPLIVIVADSPKKLLQGRGTEHQLTLPRKITLACWFSPDSRRLLCLDAMLEDLPAKDSSFEDRKELPNVCWTVWTFDAGAPAHVSYEPWVPSEELWFSYVPFHDQYSKAGLSPWSPDSSGFCYTDALGDTRVQWLGDTPTDAMSTSPVPEFINNGTDGAVVAWWSPC